MEAALKNVNEVDYSYTYVHNSNINFRSYSFNNTNNRNNGEAAKYSCITNYNDTGNSTNSNDHSCNESHDKSNMKFHDDMSFVDNYADNQI